MGVKIGCSLRAAQTPGSCQIADMAIATLSFRDTIAPTGQPRAGVAESRLWSGRPPGILAKAPYFGEYSE